LLKYDKRIVMFLLIIVLTTFSFQTSLAAEKKKDKEKEFSVPKNVLSISKTNTFPNITEDVEIIEPSKDTKGLLDAAKPSIHNPDLISLLNETSIKPSPIGFGYRAFIYLGRWPLQYQSEETSVIWDYQSINKNELVNVDADEVQELTYNQKEEQEIKGALTNKTSDSTMVKQMMLETSKKETKLPLSFSTVIGKNTKLDNIYHVPQDKTGSLHAYAPAVNEKGKVIFGEVYVKLKGSNKEIEIRNVTKQGIGAWIPIQDHVSFSFQLK